jgi:hypothetical protein
MFLGPLFINCLSQFIHLDRIAVLNLSKNNIGDLGVQNLMNVLKDNLSLVYLNLSSNDITS